MPVVEFGELVRGGDRVRANTPHEINEAIDAEIAATVRFYSDRTAYEISERLKNLIMNGILNDILKPMQLCFLLLERCLA